MSETSPGPAPAARLPYLPALDGLRGLALVAILLAHGGVTRVRGGHLALTAFFTLSGFLITGLLLGERYRTGTVDLRVFWTRRARRLVPALLLSFPLVAAVVLLSEQPPGSGLVLDAVAAATWVANWRFVVSDQSYADLFALPSPFQHFWSLAVEEQFYLVFPLVLLAVLGVRSERVRTGRLAVLLAVLAVGSTVLVAVLYDVYGPLGRAYYGTDARLAEILVGSLLALAMIGPQGLRPLPPRVRRTVDVVGAVGLAGLVTLFVTLDKGAAFTYRGGFLLAALCSAAVVAAGTLPGSVVHRVLSLRGLVWLGLVSYGVYLFHWPLFLLLTERSTGLGTGELLALRLVIVVALAAASYVLLERPVRAGGLPPLPALGGWATGAVAGVVVVAAASTAVTLVPAQEVLQVAAAAEPAAVQPTDPPPPSLAPTTAAPVAPTAAATTAGAPAVTTAPPPPAPPPPPRPAAPRRPVAAPAGIPAPLLVDPEDVPVPDPAPAPPSTLTVAVVGDSIAGNLSDGLIRWSQAEGVDVQVTSFALGGCPLIRGADRRIDPQRPFPVDARCPWLYVPSSERWKAFSALDPDVVLMEVGIAEVFDWRITADDDWRAPGDPVLDRWLLSEQQAAVERLGSLGASVLVGTAPCADWGRFEMFRDMSPGGTERVLAYNAVQRRAGVRLVDLYGRVCPGGRFEADVEGVVDARADGLHFVLESSEALARNWLGQIVLTAGGRGGG